MLKQQLLLNYCYFLVDNCLLIITAVLVVWVVTQTWVVRLCQWDENPGRKWENYQFPINGTQQVAAMKQCIRNIFKTASQEELDPNKIKETEVWS